MSCNFILGILPGPNEPSVHINTFLRPLVDDLLNLWEGVPFVYEGSRHVMRAALTAVTADLPALRKVTQFLGHKADLGCTRCKFRAEREPNTTGASGKMSYFTTTHVEERSHEEVVRQAAEYKAASTKTRAAKIAQMNGVRYSELLRLPYFDIVHMCATDPMHTFLLGMVKRETELNVNMMNNLQKEEFIRRIKSIQMPYDVGRLPNNIFDQGTGMSGVSAAQWKLYIVCYARPCLYKLLPSEHYKCMVLLAEIVSIITSPVLNHDMVVTLYRLQQDHHQLFCKLYGKWSITVNYHMSLHIPDLILDLGPPQSFWCFAYERLNGILAGTPNSKRSVEVEVANRFIQDISFSNFDIPNISNIPNSLREFADRADDQGEMHPYPQTLRVIEVLSNTEDMTRFETQLAIDRGDVDESWPLRFKYPTKLNVRIKPVFHSEICSFLEKLYGSDIEYVQPRVNKYGRCIVNGLQFSSEFNSTDRGSIVKSLFVDSDNELSPYYGIVRFFFTVASVIRQKPVKHQLAYVTWLKFRSNNPELLSKLYVVSSELLPEG